MCWCFIHYWIEKCTVKQWKSKMSFLLTETDRPLKNVGTMIRRNVGNHIVTRHFVLEVMNLQNTSVITPRLIHWFCSDRAGSLQIPFSCSPLLLPVIRRCEYQQHWIMRIFGRALSVVSFVIVKLCGKKYRPVSDGVVIQTLYRNSFAVIKYSRMWKYGT